MKEKLKKYWKTKSKWAKFSDLFFIVFIIALLFPSGRMAIGSGINRIKAIFTQPSIQKTTNELSDNDFNWKLKDTNGNKINLSQSKGKVVFINMWATWCPPCVGEMPEIQNLYDNFKNNENIDFYLVSNESLSKINKFIESKNYDLPVFHSEENTPSAFRSRSIPTTFLINKSGEIVIKETGATNWGGKKMIKIVKELINK